MATQIKLRRDTAANWTSEDPTLALGEPGFETDSGRLKLGDGATAWTALAYFDSLPAGTILLWSGSVGSIPVGYVICDGDNGTPDLRNRFIVGAGDTYAVDDTGGAASHDHGTAAAEEFSSAGPVTAVNDPTASNLPPYFSLCFIMRVS